VEDDEALQARAVVGQLTDAVEHKVNNLLAYRVVATRIVVGSILLPTDQLFGVEELAVGATADLIDNSWFQVYEDTPGDMLASARLAEEGVEGIITSSNSLVTGHLAIMLDSMLKAVQLPAGIANLDTGLAYVN
jgi:hypothetical protein